MQLQSLTAYKELGLHHLQGTLETTISSVKTPETADATALVFVSKQELIEIALKKGARVFVKVENLKYDFPAHITVFSIPSLSLGMALILPHFDKKLSRFKKSQNNSIHPTARLGEGAIVCDYAVIGEGTIIGANCIIGAHVVIENNCVIGAGTLLHPHVFVGAETEIGIKCEIHPHTTLGADGFGYVTDPKTGIHHKVPQIGRVVIEDSVEIGANCAIDRATLGVTRIKSGTKMDNHVHIAHNCEIGEGARLTAGFTMAGSSKIGKQFLCGGQAGVTDHIEICDHVTLASRGAFLHSVTEPGSYGGMPAVSLQRHLKMVRTFMDLPEMWKSWRAQNKSST